MIRRTDPVIPKQDEEGMQTMRALEHNMAWIIKKLNRSNQEPG